MRTGRLTISRGHQTDGPRPPAPRLAIVAQAEPPAPVSPAYRPLHDRLTALERLARLHEQGALTDGEFAAEKALILERHPDELVLNEPLLAADPAHGPSLLGRLFGWRLVPLGIAAGLTLSFAAQPQSTIRFFDETLRLLGA